MLRFLDFCNVLHIWECPGHPYILIESTDSMISEVFKLDASIFDEAEHNEDSLELIEAKS